MQRRSQSISVDLFGREPALDLIRRVGSFSDDVTQELITPEIIRATFRVRRKKHLYQKLLDALTETNRWYRANGIDVPLYSTGVRYEAEPLGTEVWQCLPILLLTGLGDCEDLSTARASELLKARAKIIQTGQQGGSRLFHIVVRHQDGRVEDPSRLLGMRD